MVDLTDVGFTKKKKKMLREFANGNVVCKTPLTRNKIKKIVK